MAEISPTTKLHPLEESDLTTREPAEDVRSRKVVDAGGDEIGKVDDLLIDEDERRVRFLRVASGGFLGIGQDHVLIPIDAIASITDDTVHIDQTREHVAGAPRYQPDLVSEYVRSVYGYYGLQPFWGAGYHYPTHPYFR